MVDCVKTPTCLLSISMYTKCVTFVQHFEPQAMCCTNFNHCYYYYDQNTDLPGETTPQVHGA